MPDPIIIISYDLAWPALFDALAGTIRTALGSAAIRIDHIGSTAVAGLAAKPIIDVQISVTGLEPMEPYRGPLEAVGFVWRTDNEDRTKRYFREPPGTRRIHIHVRRHGSFQQQFALLFRDYLRCHAQDAARFEAEKRRLAEVHRGSRNAYVTAKGPVIWEVMQRADTWAQWRGWEPGPTDA
jgi:GrpB-like predicted nucleotidyltransferase (UPF0157 family)